jgi:diguanylate cyclase (GGDEF)-like protein
VHLVGLQAWSVLGAAAGSAVLAGVTAVAVRHTGRRERRGLVAALAGTEAELARARSERDELADRLRHLELHDPLTGLPNRTQFQDRLRLAARPDATAAPVTVMVVDLAGFKQVNEQHGQLVGDDLLTAVADRLGGCVRGDDLVARLGADEFAVLLRCPVEQAREVAERIVAQLRRPFVFPDGTLQVQAAVGVAPAPDDRWEPEALLRLADAAMDQAKRSGRGYVLG